jgi:hypothetical protein
MMIDKFKEGYLNFYDEKNKIVLKYYSNPVEISILKRTSEKVLLRTTNALFNLHSYLHNQPLDVLQRGNFFP